MRQRSCVTFGFIAAILLVSGTAGRAELGLQKCAAAFPGGVIGNAPKHSNTDAHTTLLCQRNGDTVFFAVEYDPDKFAPLWSAYRIADTFGPNGCASMTRKDMDCHFIADDVAACMAADKDPPDPFHVDATLKDLEVERLGPGAFSGTGHDRGHVAPNNTFSWHACGAYKTFTMANMTAQWGPLNRELWADLEAQVLFWGVKDGPIHVVTGPIWSKFPSNKFKAIQNGQAKTATFAKVNEILKKTTGAKLPHDIVRPTGFFKVVFRPAQNGQPARAIAFLVPHTKQKGLSHWLFVTSVATVEEASGLRFGFATEFKGAPDLSIWRAESRLVPNNWTPRSNCAQKLPVAGFMAQRPVKERIALCTSSDALP